MEFDPVYEAGLEAIKDKEALAKSPKSKKLILKSQASMKKFSDLLDGYIRDAIADCIRKETGGFQTSD